MAQAITRQFVGKGRVWAKAVGGKYFELGNVDKVSLSAKTDVDKVLDYTKGGGGVAGTYAYVSGAGLDLSLVDFNAANLALALLGTATGITGSTVTAEVVIANLGGLSRTAKLNPTSVVVKHTSGAPTYVAGTDYDVVGGGITIKTGGAITDLQSLKVDYSYAAQTTVQSLLNSVQEFAIFIDGLNDADNGKVHAIDVFRFKPAPSSGFDLIGEKIARLAVSGEILADATKSGGLSKYFTITQID